MIEAGACAEKRTELRGIRLRAGVVAILAAFVSVPPAMAFEMESGDPELKIRWDNTFKYSAAWRIKSVVDDVAGGPGSSIPNPNLDDGDRNFDRGLISNRIDIYSELDVNYRNFGARVSAAAWQDSVYNRTNENDSPLTANSLSAAHDEFSQETKNLHGRKVELLDVFVSGKFSPGDSTLNVRAGRFTQLYGESLFFGSNGIAAAQSSPDIIKLLAVPSSQFKEILRPTGQLAASFQINPQLTIGGYYQLEWRKARLPGAGSYFSFADFADDGGERVIAGEPLVPGGGAAAFFRGDDLKARDSGQGGIQIRYQTGEWEFGAYAARFHDKFPQFYFRPGAGGMNPDSGRIGDYVLVYGQDIKTYGASFSTTLGETNVGGEISYRDDMPLAAVGNVVVDPTLEGDGRRNPLYPVGKTFHAQLSAIHVFRASPLWEGASFLGEIAFNRRLSVTKNADQLDPNATRNATAVRFIFTPEYFQVLPQVDVQVPIGLGYGVSGRSSINGIGFPAEHGGDFSIGVKADYQKLWYASLNYTRFFGRTGAVVDAAGRLSFDQHLKDRDFISFSIQRTF